jgi:curved DNA-binding protein CbpA
MSDQDAYEILQVHPAAHALVIQAAYRALAGLYHPDHNPTGASTRRMADLNLAYEKVKTAERRALYDRERTRQQAPAPSVVTPYEPRPRAAAAAGEPGRNVLDFGRYEGWTIERLAREDPDYLRWLVRHSSGIRYRSQIEAALQGTAAQPTATERTRGRRG